MPVVLHVAAPFDWRAQLDFLARRAVPGLEHADATSYARTLRLPHGPGALWLRPIDTGVWAEFRLADNADLANAVSLCRRLLDLDADSLRIDAHLAADPVLAPSVRAHPGLRVPGSVDGFEVAIRAVIGQQISVSAARTVLGKLVEAYGERLDASSLLTRLFPTASAVAALDPERLAMPRSRGRALVAIARAVDCGEVVLDGSGEAGGVRRSLLAVPGIGPWTADYVALRAIGDRDVFMASDLGVRRGLVRLGIGDSVEAHAEAWRPWRSYALMHVWRALEAD